MSIRTNPMKAVPVLLKRVKTTKTILNQRLRDYSLDGKLDKLTRELNKIEDVFIKVKNNQDALLDTLHEVDSHLRKLDQKRLNEDMDGFCKRIRDCAHKLLPMDTFDDDDSSDEMISEIVQSSSCDPSSTQQYNNHLVLSQNVNLFAERYNDLSFHLKFCCLLSLLIFPEDAVFQKRDTIYYWWTGEGNRRVHTAIDQLLKFNLIVPFGKNGKGRHVSKFKINPQIRPHLEQFVERKNILNLGYYFRMPDHCELSWLVLETKKVTLGDGDGFKPDGEIRIVFNASASYLNFASKWMDKLEFLEALQLGRWQDSPSHHIEVASQEFLKDLSNLTYLRYLSLRGISRIFELPPSIAQIKKLQILDLKACHDLQTLPDDISSLTSLTHLILSRCYLLEGMPKGIDKLTKLQVLKGFIIGSSRNTPCRISDLANLRKLRQLSIRIRAEAVIKDGEFHSLGKMSALEHLKISWGVSDTRFSHIQIILPPSLKKLHLECFPGQKIPEWLKPSKLPWRSELASTSSSEPQQLKELKITGGNLTSMNHDEDMNGWSMEIVHLKYLRHLEVDITTLQKLFPLLRYAEIRKISNHSYFEWSID